MFSEESGGLERINTQNSDLMRNVEGKDLNLGGTDVFGEVETSGYEDWATPEDLSLGSWRKKERPTCPPFNSRTHEC